MLFPTVGMILWALTG